MSNGKTPEEMQVEANRRAIDQVLSTFITPEIERRQAAGTAPKPFDLQRAQVVMNLNAAHEIRLNDEVKAVAVVPAPGPTEPGQAVAFDIATIIDVRLTDHDPNAGHITMFFAPSGCMMFFDFRYNAERVVETIDAAEQFLAAATFSASNSHGRAVAENLFATTELTAKAVLLQLPFAEVLSSKKHTAIQSKLNQFSRAGQTVDRAFVDLYNTLSRMRTTARYVAGKVPWTKDEMVERVGIARSALDRAKAQAPRAPASSTVPRPQLTRA